MSNGKILANVGVAILESRIAEIVTISAKVPMVPPRPLLFLHVFIHLNRVVAII